MTDLLLFIVFGAQDISLLTAAVLLDGVDQAAAVAAFLVLAAAEAYLGTLRSQPHADGGWELYLRQLEALGSQQSPFINAVDADGRLWEAVWSALEGARK